MKTITLRKSDIRELNKKIESSYSVPDFFNKKDKVELIDDELITQNDLPSFFYVKEQLVPTLKLIIERDFPIKKVTVDMGAVKFVISGADIMRPGITDFNQDIKQDEFVVIIDENNKRPLAIGQMLYSGEEAKKLTSGKIIKSIHRVGDELWSH